MLNGRPCSTGKTCLWEPACIAAPWICGNALYSAFVAVPQADTSPACSMGATVAGNFIVGTVSRVEGGVEAVGIVVST